MQIDRLLWAFTTYPAETSSNNSGRYTLLVLIVVPPLILYSMVWNWRVLRARPMLFYWPKLPAIFLFSTVFSFLPISMDWYCGAGDTALSHPCITDLFNNNHNSYYRKSGVSSFVSTAIHVSQHFSN